MSFTEQQMCDMYSIHNLNFGNASLTVSHSQANRNHRECLVCEGQHCVLHEVKVSVSAAKPSSGDICCGCWELIASERDLQRLAIKLQ